MFKITLLIGLSLLSGLSSTKGFAQELRIEKNKVA